MALASSRLDSRRKNLMVRTFQGPRIISVAFLSDFIAVGFFFYSYSVFFIPLSQEFGSSRLMTSLGMTIFGGVGALLSPLLGMLLDRYPIKRIMLSGCALTGVSFLLLAQAHNSQQFYLLLAVGLTSGVNAMGGMATAKMISNWYRRRIGAAMGVAAVGISLSGVIMPPIASWLIEMYGWRGGFTTYGVLTLVVCLPTLWVCIISTPADINQQPDGGAADEHVSGHTLPLQPSWSQSKLLHSRTLYLLVFVFASAYCCVQTLFTHLVPYAIDTGRSAIAAAFLVSLCAGTAVLGKLLFGLLIDRTSGTQALNCILTLQAIGLIGLLLSSNILLLSISIAAFGLGYGGGVPVQHAITVRLYGPLSFGRALGLTRFLGAPLTLIGAPMAGWLFDISGHYDWAWASMLVLIIAALISIRALPKHARLARSTATNRLTDR